MTRRDFFVKRLFDTVCALIGLVLLWPLIIVGWLIARVSSGESGFFFQERIGRNAVPFNIIKLKTMKSVTGGTTVTSSSDARITRGGKFLRASKLDELPQLINVLCGDMSLVGPRPDVRGFADRLDDSEKCLLLLRPGITGPATLAFRDEESLLASVPDPEKYNREVIWPEKVRINLQYFHNYSFFRDIELIIKTLF